MPHTPVLLQTTVELLNVRPGGRFIDATLGTGGHAEAILQLCSPDGSLLGIDADPRALEVARQRLSPYGKAVTFDAWPKSLKSIAAEMVKAAK